MVRPRRRRYCSLEWLIGQSVTAFKFVSVTAKIICSGIFSDSYICLFIVNSQSIRKTRYSSLRLNLQRLCRCDREMYVEPHLLVVVKQR